MVAELLVGFVFGIAGSLHCVAMCGPILLALNQPNSTTRGLFTLAHGNKLLYHLSRITVYSLLGGLVGFGAYVADLAGIGQIVSVTAGILMIVVAGFQLLANKRVFSGRFVIKLTAPARSVAQTLLHNQSRYGHIVLGALNGLLPCGLVVAALFGSATTGSPIQGMAFMAFFGLGTLPTLLAIQFGAGVLPSGILSRFRRVMPFLAILLGVLLVVRGLHLGIPYVSPHSPLQNISKENVCVDSLIKTK